MCNLHFTGFAFVTFESEDTVDKVVDVHYHDINNKTVCSNLENPSTLAFTFLLETLRRPLFPYGFSYKASCARPD